MFGQNDSASLLLQIALGVIPHFPSPCSPVCRRHQRFLQRVIHHLDTFYECTAPDGDYRKGCLKMITARGI